MTPERIFAGADKPTTHRGTQALSDVQKRRVAEFMSGRPMGSINAGEAKAMPNQCASNPAMTDPARSAVMERMGERSREHAIPAGRGRAADRG